MIAIHHKSNPIIIEVIESRNGFLVMYEQRSPMTAISTPVTAMLSSYTTAKVIGSPCSKINDRFLCVEAFFISLIAIPRVIDSMTNDIPRMINVQRLICISPGVINDMIP